MANSRGTKNTIYEEPDNDKHNPQVDCMRHCGAVTTLPLTSSRHTSQTRFSRFKRVNSLSFPMFATIFVIRLLRKRFSGIGSIAGVDVPSKAQPKYYST